MERLVPAFAIPVGVAIFVFIIVFGYSRILLAVGDQMISTAIALIGALLILVVCTVLASRSGGRRT